MVDHRILTDADAAVLVGKVEEDLSERALEQRRIRMRKRIRDGIIEIGALVDLLDPENRESVFSPPQNANADQDMMEEAARQLIQLGYLGIKPIAVDATEYVEKGVKLAENQYSIETTGRQNQAEVELTVTPHVIKTDIDGLANRFREGPSQLTREELAELLSAVAGAESAFPEIDMMDVVQEMQDRDE